MIGDESCVAALIESLTDPYETVRKYAVQALARIRDRSAVEHLLGALEDEDTYVREAARETLREIFRIEYNPVTKQTINIPEEKLAEFESLPVEEQRRIERHRQVILEKIQEMDRRACAHYLISNLVGSDIYQIAE
jgi:hypothetical protein